MLTSKLVRKARSVGLEPHDVSDAQTSAALASLAERAAARDPHPDDPLTGEGRHVDREVGQVLFAVAGLAQRLGVDAEQALRERALSLRAEILAAEGVPDEQGGDR